MQQSVVATMKACKQCGFIFNKSAKHTSVEGRVIAIRREDQSVWERRAPLAPSNVRRLARAGVKVIVQPSNRRAYPMQTYAAAGAVIQEDISEASVIFGVKQVPVDLLIPNKTYCLFSHTIKAQDANMPLLDAILEKNIRLIDYEKLMDERGQRVVAFGKYAGLAGMVNILHGLGLRLLALGHHTPFMHIGPAHNYRNSSMARQAIRDAGYEIALGMMPKSIGPLTFVFTGSGNVSQGGQEVFQELPHEYVPPDMLRKVAEHGSHTKIYGCEVRRRHYLERKEGGGFDSEEFEKFPSRYISTFSKKIAPYASVIINGIYWAVDSPKLLTIPDAKTLLRPANTPWLPSSVGSPALPHRMLAICDISADPGGSVEFMNECTTIDTPFCLYDADRNKDTKSFKGPGVLVCSIDNMPTQLPRESTDFFGDLLYPYAFDILQSDATQPLEKHNFSPSVAGAIIASNGKLTPNFQYIQDLRLANRSSRHKVSGSDGEAPASRVIVLGAGMVSAPLVEYLHRGNNLNITVASALKAEADAIAGRFPGVEPVLLDVVERADMLQDLIGAADLVVSLLPSPLHYLVAEACINAGVHLVTASYCTDELKDMHDRAAEKGITILNEVGLDPGIDHLLAMECFDEVHQAGGKVESFISFCGGLPAPECSDNALRYKFSWNPRGVLLNTLGTAAYIQNGQIVQIAGGQLMRETRSLDFLPGFALEGFPNRDSTKYAKLYGIENESHTVLRGTLRFQGFADTIQGLLLLGLMDPNPHPALHPKGPEITWRQLVCTLLGVVDPSIFYENLKTRVAACVGTERVSAIESLGLLEEDPVLKLGTPLDSLSHFLSRKLFIENGERDLVVLRHEVAILWPDGKRELRAINLVEYGEIDGHSAMAKAVGFPAAIASKMILDGEIQQKGCILPLTPDIYRPILSRLRSEGLRAKEQSCWV
ncbi:Alpha-aminoadipic semialdehyde synthase, mitochondrial [Cryptotermes secundus]|uniref:Alpha-aminoadipic semialdehyde synthase, mitochondrial n=3 Tax=Cryptotermes secundus TaxID=105785 RepID=A0A2J7PFD0_9NEOP|nr:alpha-aminoadipic semialdehyde synthase, mitochondrial [Cryptotermes secundus]PNF15025.1 Alpha-aminoadipic semialdehyde synthase, mitochondrial [Cryptotermes secundus]PNF15027.1 Alpha-aminoadipic semialdehyde synthase, mitochondrial [Cryptotermes secundus]